MHSLGSTEGLQWGQDLCGCVFWGEKPSLTTIAVFFCFKKINRHWLTLKGRYALQTFSVGWSGLYTQGHMHICLLSRFNLIYSSLGDSEVPKGEACIFCCLHKVCAGSETAHRQGWREGRRESREIERRKEKEQERKKERKERKRGTQEGYQERKTEIGERNLQKKKS